MRIIPLMLVHFLPFLVLILKLRTTVSSSGKSVEDVKENKAYSEVFPSFNDVVSMSRLSMLVYDFKYDQNFTCTNFPSSHKNITKDLTCEMYLHDETLGTQVLLVSNKRERYIAIVFAGTDDIRTSLEDVNIFTKPFGNNSTVVLDAINATFDEKVTKKVRVHAGFNNAIFTGDIWEQIYSKTQSLLKQHPSFRLWTTGHSLGAANAILVATAFASLNRNRKVLNVNFGCPQSGNAYWRDYFTAKASPLNNNLGIWRVVLASDLIARLPEFFYHVGHTIQINGKTNDLKVYYEHYGDIQRGFSGAPSGWYSKSYYWLPSAMAYHRLSKYMKHLEEMDPSSWVKYFHPAEVDDIINDYEDPDLVHDETRLTKMSRHIRKRLY